MPKLMAAFAAQEKPLPNEQTRANPQALFTSAHAQAWADAQAKTAAKATAKAHTRGHIIQGMGGTRCCWFA